MGALARALVAAAVLCACAPPGPVASGSGGGVLDTAAPVAVPGTALDLEGDPIARTVLQSHDVPPAPPVDCTDCCYELRARASTDAGAPPYIAPSGESLHVFTFAAPWPEGDEIISLDPLFDSAVTAHLQLINAPVTREEIMPNEIGSYLGMPSRLLMSSPRGSGHLRLPADTSLAVDHRGLWLEVLYHNATGTRLPDRSGFRVCTAAPRARSASLSLLGTENLGGPIGMPEGSFSFRGVCEPREQEGPIELLAVLPQMHQLGVQMRQMVMRADGTGEVAWTAPFSFGSSNWNDRQLTLMPGDVLTTECTYDNDSGRTVGYGTSLHQEQCYALVLATPPAVLENGVISLIGIENSCWRFGE